MFCLPFLPPQIIDGHMATGFDSDVAKMAGKLVDASIELHRNVSVKLAVTSGCFDSSVAKTNTE
jgi:hypothetical protein